MKPYLFTKTVSILLLLSLFVRAEVSPTKTAANQKEQQVDCEKINWKTDENKSEIKLIICKNGYDQFFEKSCKDGCEFKNLLKSTDVQIKTDKAGSPGGQICKALSLNSINRKIQFNNKTYSISFCQAPKSQTAIISMGFLSDLYTTEKGE